MSTSSKKPAVKRVLQPSNDPVAGSDGEEDEAEDLSEYLAQKKKKEKQMTSTVAVIRQQNQHEEAGEMIEIFLNDRLGKKLRVKCNSDGK
jgi:hypothetical protein